MYINITSDNILMNNRNTNSKFDSNTNTKSHYSIPYGGMFHYVSCANYFGEIIGNTNTSTNINTNTNTNINTKNGRVLQ